jgi:hypothetical protein
MVAGMRHAGDGAGCDSRRQAGRQASGMPVVRESGERMQRTSPEGHQGVRQAGQGEGVRRRASGCLGGCVRASGRQDGQGHGTRCQGKGGASESGQGQTGQGQADDDDVAEDGQGVGQGGQGQGHVEVTSSSRLEVVEARQAPRSRREGGRVKASSRQGVEQARHPPGSRGRRGLRGWVTKSFFLWITCA